MGIGELTCVAGVMTIVALMAGAVGWLMARREAREAIPVPMPPREPTDALRVLALQCRDLHDLLMEAMRADAQWLAFRRDIEKVRAQDAAGHDKAEANAIHARRMGDIRAGTDEAPLTMVPGAPEQPQTIEMPSHGR
ncbi:MAG: hypothetical protein V1929_05495 [bacterium]